MKPIRFVGSSLDDLKNFPGSDNWEGTSLNEPLHNSTGNVFMDLGFPLDEAVILQMRSNLMIDVIRVIESKDLTESQAAEMLGISQARVSD